MNFASNILTIFLPVGTVIAVFGGRAAAQSRGNRLRPAAQGIIRFSIIADALTFGLTSRPFAPWSCLRKSIS